MRFASVKCYVCVISSSFYKNPYILSSLWKCFYSPCLFHHPRKCARELMCITLSSRIGSVCVSHRNKQRAFYRYQILLRNCDNILITRILFLFDMICSRTSLVIARVTIYHSVTFSLSSFYLALRYRTHAPYM